MDRMEKSSTWVKSVSVDCQLNNNSNSMGL